MNEEASAGEEFIQSSLAGFRKGQAVPEESGNIWFSVRLVHGKIAAL
jgi:hypothetical protein